jgi:hypothetical protein
MATKAQIQEKYKNLLNSNAELIKIHDGLSKSYTNLLDRNKELVKELSDTKSKLLESDYNLECWKRRNSNQVESIKKVELSLESRNSYVRKLESFIAGLAIDGALK